MYRWRISYVSIWRNALSVPKILSLTAVPSEGFSPRRPARILQPPVSLAILSGYIPGKHVEKMGVTRQGALQML